MEESFTFFWSGIFSQWHPCKFIIEKNEYNCAEQWMMAQKAIIFGDNETLNCILATNSPREQKKLGRKVKNFDENKWNNVAKEVVYKGNYAKFTQNIDLLDKLLATVGTELVEASPLDKVWGIGLAATDLRAKNKATWQGKNWLGEVLTKLRDNLIANNTILGSRSELYNLDVL